LWQQHTLGAALADTVSATALCFGFDFDFFIFFNFWSVTLYYKEETSKEGN
jgi:hypothetical protein